MEKNKVYVECSEQHQAVKAIILTRDEHQMFVEFPTGYQMTLIRRHINGHYLCQLGMLEFVSNGRPVK
jgi:hypothetical protein